ncbi:hypothetical protein N7463_007918 [Penicillium fimorum]|uniref:Uncharacterized protein n=1 Tax=Penicillium fimorum TaxID=1882269 RepID=A0A9W9XX66_9EURO|nr:hypothetical protein N7463_007918 [Penicillium fimorum]
MAAYAQIASKADLIFAKYFQSKDKDTAMKMSSNISRGGSTNPTGSDILGKVSIVTDYKADGDYACKFKMNIAVYGKDWKSIIQSMFETGAATATPHINVSRIEWNVNTEQSDTGKGEDIFEHDVKKIA